MHLRIFVALFLLVMFGAMPSYAQSDTTFSYQGQLQVTGSPAEGLFDFQFSLWDEPTTGSQVANTISISSLQVLGGLIETELNFGVVSLAGPTKWIQIEVRESGVRGDVYTTLSPRRPLLGTPIAIHARNAWSTSGNSNIDPASNFIGTTDRNSLIIKAGGITALRIQPSSLGGLVPSIIGGSPNNIISDSNSGAIIVGGGTNQLANVVNGGGGVIVGGAGNLNNSGLGVIVSGIGNTTEGGNDAILGGAQNKTLGSAAIVGGGVLNAAGRNWSSILGGLRNTTDGSESVIVGGADNLTTAGKSVVVGGEYNRATEEFAIALGGQSNDSRGHGSVIISGYKNRAEGFLSVVTNGFENEALGPYDTVVGGSLNVANSQSYASVIGGLGNRATGEYSNILGGGGNLAIGGSSVVIGGFINMASGRGSVILGGEKNEAGGLLSIVGGRRAIARSSEATGDEDGDEGTFVWADSTDEDYISTGPNQFLVRASGGFGLNRNNPEHPFHVGTDTINGNGAHVTADGMWTNGSSRRFKSNFRHISPVGILETLAHLPIERWSYNGNNEQDHIGPTAEDFRAAFGLGHSDQYIGTVDADGVALVAIQGLNIKLEEKEATIRAQQREIDDLKDRLTRLEALILLSE